MKCTVHRAAAVGLEGRRWGRQRTKRFSQLNAAPEEAKKPTSVERSGLHAARAKHRAEQKCQAAREWRQALCLFICVVHVFKHIHI